MMFERKARKILDAYLQAELNGEDEKAEQLEDELNKGGWKITVGPEGMTVVKAEKEIPDIDTSFFPTDEVGQASRDLYPNQNKDKGGSPILLTIGIVVVLAAIIGVIIWYSQKKAI